MAKMSSFKAIEIKSMWDLRVSKDNWVQGHRP